VGKRLTRDLRKPCASDLAVRGLYLWLEFEQAAGVRILYAAARDLLDEPHNLPCLR